jgi:hypothetical protein
MLFYRLLNVNSSKTKGSINTYLSSAIITGGKSFIDFHDLIFPFPPVFHSFKKVKLSKY